MNVSHRFRYFIIGNPLSGSGSLSALLRATPCDGVPKHAHPDHPEALAAWDMFRSYAVIVAVREPVARFCEAVSRLRSLPQPAGCVLTEAAVGAPTYQEALAAVSELLAAPEFLVTREEFYPQFIWIADPVTEVLATERLAHFANDRQLGASLPHPDPAPEEPEDLSVRARILTMYRTDVLIHAGALAGLGADELRAIATPQDKERVVAVEVGADTVERKKKKRTQKPEAAE